MKVSILLKLKYKLSDFYKRFKNFPSIAAPPLSQEGWGGDESFWLQLSSGLRLQGWAYEDGKEREERQDCE